MSGGEDRDVGGAWVEWGDGQCVREVPGKYCKESISFHRFMVSSNECDDTLVPEFCGIGRCACNGETRG